MNFADKYPELTLFFKNNFPLDEFGFDSTEDLVDKAIGAGDETLILEGEKLLQEIPFPEEELEDITNLYFRNDTAARQWLESLLLVINRSLNDSSMEV